MSTIYDINPEYVVTGLDHTFRENDEVIPDNVGYYSLDSRELRMGNGIDKWSDIVPFIYNAESITVINNWDHRKDSNVPSSTLVYDRLTILEKASGSHNNSIIDFGNRIASLESTRAPNNHASTATTYGLGTTNNYGHLKLSDSTNSTSDISKGVAATPNAVRKTYELADTANTTANTAKTTADTNTTNISNVKVTAETANSTANAAYAASLIPKATNPVTAISNDTTAKWSSLGSGVYWFNTAKYLNNQPSTYGFLINTVYGTDVFQIWSAQNSGPIYFRQGNANGWGNTWTRIPILNSSNQLVFPNGTSLWIA
jgi:hypothetical protein